jgi:DNA-binding transcriptional LysR family regulator
MRLDPLSLKLFVAVAETGTITAAAAREHIVASALSKRLSELEARLGTELLTRSNKGIKVTPAGAILLRSAREILRSLEDIEFEISEQRARVRIAATIVAIVEYLQEPLVAFTARYPTIQLHLVEDTSQRVLTAVAQNIADLGIFSVGPHDHIPDMHLDVLPYKRFELVLIVPTQHALAASTEIPFVDSLQFDFIELRAVSEFNHQMIGNPGQFQTFPKARILVNSYDAMCRMVAAGLGVGLLPLGCAHIYAKAIDFKIVKLTDPWRIRELKICTRSRDALANPVKLLADHLTLPP